MKVGEIDPSDVQSGRIEAQQVKFGDNERLIGGLAHVKSTGQQIELRSIAFYKISCFYGDYIKKSKPSAANRDSD